jgi:hypothetical protein
VISGIVNDPQAPQNNGRELASHAIDDFAVHVSNPVTIAIHPNIHIEVGLTSSLFRLFLSTRRLSRALTILPIIPHHSR